MRFVFCLHNHQPEGQSRRAVEEAYERAYWPVLVTISEHPSIRVVLHNSGSLLEWLIASRPAYVELLSQLVDRGQVELLSSPIFEPILAIIPERERVAQIRAHQELIERTFGVVPRGLWLAERVWEPSLPKVIGQAGIEYMPLDDTPFLRIGVLDKRLYDSFVTEDEGMPIRVFPVPRSLRDLIPAAKPEEVVAQLLKRQTGGGRVAVFADDGAKFGAWPGSFERVQEGRWLSRFFALLEREHHRLQTCTLEEVVEGVEAAGQLYLPTGTYGEMMEWSIPPEAQRRHHSLRTRLEQEGNGLDRFLGMGYWRNFLVRYPEANWMHKRGLDLLRRVQALEDRGADPERVAEARRLVWRSLSHGAYWHGVHGGVYAPQLRRAVFTNQIRAWELMDRMEHGDEPFQRFSHRDIDLDGDDEVVVENRELALTLAPHDGGTLIALDLKPRAVNLCDTVARREESYHSAIRERRDDASGSKGGRRRQSKSDLASYLNYDPFPLYSLRDHVFDDDVTLATIKDLRTLSAPPARTRYEWEREGPGRLRLFANCRVESSVVEIEREVVLDPERARFDVVWHLAFPDGLPDGWMQYATEWTFGLGAPGRAGRYMRFAEGESHDIGTEDEIPDVDRWGIVDERRGFEVNVSLEPRVRVLRFPIETVSLNGHAPTRVFQSTRVFLVWPLVPDRGRVTLRASLEILSTDARVPEPVTAAEGDDAGV